MSEFETFYRENLRLVYGMALAKGGKAWEAEDLTQETFLRAWRHFDTLAGMDSAAQRGWLVRTLRHLAVDTWRKERARPSEAPEMSSPGPDVSERVALQMDVARALAGLNEEDREVVVLRYFMEMNSREIGEMLGIPEGTIRYYLMRCRRHLAEQLAHWTSEGDRS